MKKVLLILTSIIIIVVVALVAIPYFFKDDIKSQLQEYLSSTMDAKIEIGDYDLSIFSNFPKMTFQLEEFLAESNDSIYSFSVKDLELVLNSKGIIFDKSINIERVVLDSPHVIYKIPGENTKFKGEEIQGIVNSSDKLDEESGSSDISLSISQYEIINGLIEVKDDKDNPLLSMRDFNHNGFGVFSDNNLILNTRTDVNDISAEYGNIKYLNQAKLFGEFNIELDLKRNYYFIKENNLKLNNLELNWVGLVKQIEEENFEIDVKFNTPNSKFKDLLNMIPEEFKKDFDKVDSDGTFKVEGSVIGLLNQDLLPKIDVTASLNNAYFKYEDLNEKIDNINFILNVSKPQAKSLNSLTVDIPKLSFDLMKNAFYGNLNLSNLIDDPRVKAYIKTNIYLSDIKYAIPLDKDENIKGYIESDVTIEGVISDLEKENYDKFKASGNFKVKNIDYKNKRFSKEVKIVNADISISPQYLILKDLNINIGESDLQAKGKVSKYLEYAFKDQTLQGSLNMTSKRISMKDLQAVESSTDETPEAEEEMSLIEIPGKIDFKNELNFKEVLFGNIVIKDIKGSLGIANSKAYMKNLRMNIFGGKMSMSGDYANIDTTMAKGNFELTVDKFDIKEIASKLNFVEEIAPIAKSARGKVSAKLSLNTDIDSKMSPKLNTLNSTGKLNTFNLRLENSDFLEDLGNVLNISELKGDPKISDTQMTFKIVNGQLTLDPFKLKINDIEANFDGHSDIVNSTLDMNAGIVMPRKYLGKDLNKILDDAVKLANKAGLKSKIDDKISVNALISGDVNSPKYSLTYGPERARTPKEYLTNEAKKLLDKAKKEAGNTLKDKAKNLLKGLF